jgi:hypothetical protein
MNPKFIINEGRLKMGLVNQHMELANNHLSTLGGGWWHMDKDRQIIWLYGRSQLFGKVSRKILQEVIASGQHDYPGFTFFYSSSSNPETALLSDDKL